MRAEEFNLSNPVEELAKKLPTLKKIDYDAIDELMQRISYKHKLSGQKLHDLFVKKYGHTPDTWVRKIKQRNEDVTETTDSDDQMAQINQFVEWAKKTLNVKGDPKFTFSRDTEKAQEGHHTGVHSGNDIWVYIGKRNLVDIFRTVFHELVHQRQDELGMIKDGDSYPGSPIEAMADMLAGKYIKIYGKEHPEIFQ
jgi:hypothetical protein